MKKTAPARIIRNRFAGPDGYAVTHDKNAKGKSGRLNGRGTRNSGNDQPTDPTISGDAADLSIMGQPSKAALATLNTPKY